MTMISRAAKEANKSVFKRARVGAVIRKGNRVLSHGFNQIRGVSGCPTPLKWINSVHAEQAAILKLLKKRKQRDLVGATLYVTRVLKNGDFANAKPCKFCQGLIHAVGIKKVVYTTETGLEEYAVK